MKKFCDGIVVSKNKVADGLFELVVKVDEVIEDCKCGQFVSLYVDDKSKLLPRPISISEINIGNKTLTFVIQKVGKGTKLLSKVKANKKVSMLLPLGNGYDLEKLSGTVYLIGGGVGIPPLVGTYQELKKLENVTNIKVILGFRDEPFLTHKFFSSDLEICSDSGNFGFKGNVVEKLKDMDIPNYIISCGPKPMLKGVVEYSELNSIESQISMEERMACSIGVCVGCVIDTIEDGQVVKKKVCVDGPVFRGGEIVFE